MSWKIPISKTDIEAMRRIWYRNFYPMEEPEPTVKITVYEPVYDILSILGDRHTDSLFSTPHYGVRVLIIEGSIDLLTDEGMELLKSIVDEVKESVKEGRGRISFSDPEKIHNFHLSLFPSGLYVIFYK